nr:uncharacterized protein LOC106623953 [Bactrocera oleae]
MKGIGTNRCGRQRRNNSFNGNDKILLLQKNKVMSDESEAILVSIESDELKEGEIRVEGIADEKKNALNDDANSVSTEMLSPLLIEKNGQVKVVDDNVKMKERANNEVNENIISSVEKDAEEDFTDIKPSKEIC